MIKIYTDGSCSGNPGPGASAFIVIQEDPIVYLHQGVMVSPRTTNNEAELTAVAMAIDHIMTKGIQDCKIYSDSQYVVNGINAWMQKWAFSRWTASNGKPIQNMLAWQGVYESWNRAVPLLNCSIYHVKGHSDNKWNALVDKIARKAVKHMR